MTSDTAASTVAETQKSSSNILISELPSVDDDRTRIAVAGKGVHFWMVFLAICVSLFLSALDLTAVATALPTIVSDLNGQQFVWVSSAYSLASTALLPASGGFAQIFGRRATMLASLLVFAVGSALCGSATTMNWLIAARTVQGAGGGGILSLSSIIVSDMVSLQERGTYNGILGMTWALAGCIGPLIGGALASGGHWRWLFYLNLPISGLAAVLVLVFLRLHTPPGSLREKFARIDWIGNLLIIGSSSACILSLTWGGVRFPWVSVHVLLPLILGLAGIMIFLIYEAVFAKEPIVPFSLLTNRTSLSGYIQTFLCPAIMLSIIFFLPVYFQACKEASPIRSGVLILGLCTSTGITLVISGASVTVSKVYRPQLWIGWAVYIASMGAMSTLTADAPLSRSVGVPFLVGIAPGIIYATTYFPVLAPLPVTQNAHALAFFAFCRSLAGAWGISISTAILQTQLAHRLPAEFVQEFPGGISFAYTIIPTIRTLPEPTRTLVREAFADSLIVIWQVTIGVAGLGLLASLVMKALPLHTEMDKRWSIEHAERTQEVEKPRSLLTQ